MSKIVRIVPPPLPKIEEGRDAPQFQPTRGTKVYAEDGAEIRGITRIEILGNLDDVWRAKIECVCEPPEITCLADIEYRRFDLESIAQAIFVTFEPRAKWDELTEHYRALWLACAVAACNAIRQSQGIK